MYNLKQGNIVQRVNGKRIDDIVLKMLTVFLKTQNSKRHRPI